MAVTYQEHELPNGLRIIAETDPEAHTASAGFFVRTGARDEDESVMGVSHFLEHMMFKGTEDLDADAINRGFDEIGARNNAYTSAEMTCFYASSLPEHLPRSLELLGRMMRPALRQSDFDTEKSVILEEIAMYKDNPFWVLYEEAIDRFYRPHPLRHRVLGTDETITALSRDAMETYFNDRYSADNTVLSLAGRVDFDAVCAQAEALCGGWARTGATRDAAAPGPNTDRFELRDARVNRGYLLGLSPAPPAQDERRYAASLLSRVLGAGDNSRLHWALVETGLAEEAQSAYDGNDGTGTFFVYASCDPGRVDEIEAIIDREITGLVDSLTEDDLERLRSKSATAVTIGGERPGDRMQRLGRQRVVQGAYRSLAEELEHINAVTLDDMRELAASFSLQPVVFGRMLPAEG